MAAMEMQGSSSDSDDKVQVKTEPLEEDIIKDYAENTMNELLAIYGYEKVDEGMTKELYLQHFSEDEKREIKRPHSTIMIKQEEALSHRSGSTDQEPSSAGSPIQDHLCPNNSDAPASACTSAECSDSENIPAEYEIICAWCQHFGYKRYTLNTTSESKAFCSEKCFAACRRAYFKRNKVCDWCRHIRHTKEYIEFQDGERKLQFCSEKCLNQYKMDVFCQETQSLGNPSGLLSNESEAGNEQGSIGACNSSDETETGESGLDGNAVADISASTSVDKLCRQGNDAPSIQRLTQDLDCPLPGITTHKKAKSKTFVNISSVKHVVIAPKVSTCPQPSASVSLEAPAPAVVPSVHTFPSRANPSSSVIGLQPIIQQGLSANQLVTRTPVVVRGTHWPPVVRQVPSYVMKGQQPVNPNQLILPGPGPTDNNPMAGGSVKAHDGTALPLSSPKANSNENEMKSSSKLSNHLLPPVTVIVPQPVFIPIPFPVPIPIPVGAETFYAMKRAFSASSTETNTNRGSFKPCTKNLDLRTAQCSGSVFPDAAAASSSCEQDDPHGLVINESHSIAGGGNGELERHADSSVESDPACFLGSDRKAWQPFFSNKTLQRSASMDLSLTRPSEKATHHPARSHRDQGAPISRSSGNISTSREVCFQGESAVHLSGESSAKVREALRCHLTKRLSQSALNLTDVGRMSNLKDDLRRCQSLNRLRYTEAHHMENLPELVDGRSPTSPCYSTSNQRQTSSVTQSGDAQVDQVTMKTEVSEYEEDASEPESKRPCLNHV